LGAVRSRSTVELAEPDQRKFNEKCPDGRANFAPGFESMSKDLTRKSFTAQGIETGASAGIVSASEGDAAMNNVDLVKEVVQKFCENKQDENVLNKYFAPDFEHTANGKRGRLKDYAERLAAYGKTYEHFRIPAWDDIFAAGDKVVTSYVLEANKAGKHENFAVMAIWRVKDGKITALREVDAPV
jgi:ketosteroid isomerase-like protein